MISRKKFEWQIFFLIFKGRTWYSPHRGRLWIHAASKVPTDEEIAAVQQMYLQNGGQNDVKFPSNLPVSCLLGCVDVDDVIAQEEYREKYPKGESSSPFVFICTHPQELMLKYPMNGQHKICKYHTTQYEKTQSSFSPKNIKRCFHEFCQKVCESNF